MKGTNPEVSGRRGWSDGGGRIGVVEVDVGDGSVVKGVARGDGSPWVAGADIGETVLDSDAPDCEGTEKKGVECFVIGDAFFNEDTNSGVVGSCIPDPWDIARQSLRFTCNY